MAKFIEISNRTTINIEEVQWITKSEDNLSCIVCIGDKEFPSKLPYSSMINMLKKNEQKEVQNFHFAG